MGPSAGISPRRPAVFPRSPSLSQFLQHLDASPRLPRLVAPACRTLKSVRTPPLKGFANRRAATAQRPSAAMSRTWSFQNAVTPATPSGDRPQIYEHDAGGGTLGVAPERQDAQQHSIPGCQRRQEVGPSSTSLLIMFPVIGMQIAFRTSETGFRFLSFGRRSHHLRVGRGRAPCRPAIFATSAPRTSARWPMLQAPSLRRSVAMETAPCAEAGP